MKRWISLALSLALMLNLAFVGIAKAENETGTQPTFDSLDDPTLRSYIEGTLYEALIDELDGEEFFIENVSAIYISQDYLDELEYNSKANVFFGYTLSELEAQFEGNRYVFTLGESGETEVKEWEDYYEDPLGDFFSNLVSDAGVLLARVTVLLMTGEIDVYDTIEIIFAMTADGVEALMTMARAAWDSLTEGIIILILTGDISEALEAAVLTFEEDFVWCAIAGKTKSISQDIKSVAG